MSVSRTSATDREILRPLWKVHILHHASKSRVIGNWLLEELREHGYRVSPGTLYPLLARMVTLGWLRKGKDGRYAATDPGRKVLGEVQRRLVELQREVFPIS
jgi:PadR family transcriptional regulator PadR